MLTKSELDKDKKTARTQAEIQLLDARLRVAEAKAAAEAERGREAAALAAQEAEAAQSEITRRSAETREVRAAANEAFDVGVRNDALDFASHDRDGDHKLSFEEARVLALVPPHSDLRRRRRGIARERRVAP